MKILIVFKNGRTISVLSHDHKPGEFSEWVVKNLHDDNDNLIGYITFNDCFINLNEILYIQEIKS